MWCLRKILLRMLSLRKVKHLLCVFLTFFLLGFSNGAMTQEEFILSPSHLITKFPFHMLTGGILLVKARLTHISDSLNFIFDTGSGGISLDSTTCLHYNIPNEQSDKTIRGIAGIRRVRFVYHQSLYFPGLAVDSLNFHVSDYEVLSSVYGEKIDGIIGYSFFSRYIVKIDYDSLKILVYSKGALKYPKGWISASSLFFRHPH